MNIGYRTWIIFACTNIAIVPLIYFFYPETAFRTLEEVDVIFCLADERPGNPWLNAVKISLNEPLWFGKRGEDTGFQYSDSSWHKRFLGSSGSGSGNSGSNNEKRSRKAKGSGSDSSGSDTVVQAQPHLTNKASRSRSESPIDPDMHIDHDHSPTHTLTTTITSHRNDSRRSLRDVLTRSRSSEQRSAQAAREFAAADEQQRLQSMQARPAESPKESAGVERFSPNADPEWWDIGLAPQPLRASEEHRPYSSDSTAFQHSDRVEQDLQLGTADNSYASMNYPGRLEDGTGNGERAALGSRGSDRAARGAGRAY